MSAAEGLAEAISLGVRARRLRRGGFSEAEIEAPPLPLSAHTEADQRNWLDTAESVIDIYGAPPPPQEGMGVAPDPGGLTATALSLWVVGLVMNCVCVALAGPWAALGIIGGAICASAALVASRGRGRLT